MEGWGEFGKIWAKYFSGKYHITFGHYVNFSYVYFPAKMSCPQSWLSSYAYDLKTTHSELVLSLCVNVSVCVQVRMRTLKWRICRAETEYHTMDIMWIIYKCYLLTPLILNYHEMLSLNCVSVCMSLCISQCDYVCLSDCVSTSRPSCRL